MIGGMIICCPADSNTNFVLKTKANHERNLVRTSIRALMFDLFQVALWCERDSQSQKHLSRKTVFKKRNLSCSFSVV